jgi:hypothetical protein
VNSRPQTLAKPQPETQQPKHSNHRRTGKIARLSQEQRHLINTMLQDGVPYAKIIHSLNRSDKPPPLGSISIDNLSRWKAGGYQDWLREQAWLEEMRLRLDFQNIAQQENGALLDAASLRIAVVRMYTLLTQFDPSVLTDKIANEPSTYPRILNALCKLTQTAVHLDRHRDKKDSESKFRSVWSSAIADIRSPAPGNAPPGSH